MSMGMHSRTNQKHKIYTSCCNHLKEREGERETRKAAAQSGAGGDGVDKFLELYSSCSMHVRLNSLSDYAEI